jgi:hypothetical protein
VVDVDVEVASEQEPRSVTLQPGNRPSPLSWAERVATVTVLDGHAMIVLRS